MTQFKLKPLIAGNWKMNGLQESLEQLQKMYNGLSDSDYKRADFLICPPFTLLNSCAALVQHVPFAIGAQNCHAQNQGAHTGDISAQMIKDLGASYVIIGHSERRQDHGETNEDVRLKAESVHKNGLTAIICVGETQEQREAGETLSVVAKQISESLPSLSESVNTIIAYEPIWAIGTGLTPTLEDIVKVHHNMRELLSARFAQEGEKMHLLYGGSVKPSNAKDILALDHVHGALIGGASLQASDFLSIAKAVD